MTHPLLTPRYMVEADYPNSPFRVGDVLRRHVYLESDETYYVYAKVPDNFNIVLHDYIDDDVIVKYPHIFRPMHWSEQRELGEMPRWVIWRSTGAISPCEWVEHKKSFGCLIRGQKFTSLNAFLPATESEYLEYLKSKEK